MSQNLMHQEVTILIAEDDDGHAELIREHFEEIGMHNPLRRFVNGQEVWDFLTGAGPGAHREEGRAYLLLLDIRMPKLDGVEVLRRIKGHPLLHGLPVIMLTTTNNPQEVQQCYDLGCNSYVTKPIHHQQFAEALQRLGLFIGIMQVAVIDCES